MGDDLTDVPPNTPGVRFRSVPGFSAYVVGTDGSVWRKTKTCGWRKRKPQQRSREVPYLTVSFWVRGRNSRVFRYVHRLVLELFVGPCPAGMEALHDDGDPVNNRLDNLRWGTKTENAADKARHGTAMRGGRHWNAKFTEADVLAIRAAVRSGVSQAEVARRYNTTRWQINNIWKRRIWRHLSDDQPMED